LVLRGLPIGHSTGALPAHPEYRVRARDRQATAQEQVWTVPNLSNNPSLSDLEQYAVLAYFCGSVVTDKADQSVFVV
jgi:hypothetical protein